MRKIAKSVLPAVMLGVVVIACLGLVWLDKVTAIYTDEKPAG